MLAEGAGLRPGNERLYQIAHVADREAQLCRFVAIHVHLELGVAPLKARAHKVDARQGACLVLDGGGKLPHRVQVIALDIDLDIGAAEELPGASKQRLLGDEHHPRARDARRSAGAAPSIVCCIP